VVWGRPLVWRRPMRWRVQWCHLGVPWDGRRRWGKLDVGDGHPL
jgi:hypothetical protein